MQSGAREAERFGDGAGRGGAGRGAVPAATNSSGFPHERESAAAARRHPWKEMGVELVFARKK